MSTYRFPEQKTLFSGKPFSGEILERVLAEIYRAPRPFTGYLAVAAGGGTLRFLFFLQGDPYAAGKFAGRRPLDITIREFITETVTAPAPQTMALHETDPVLLKCLLVFLQEEVTVKAPISLIDLEPIIRMIGSEAGDAVIVLEREQSFNFYFLKAGKVARCHMADDSFTPPADLTRDDQLLLYAFQDGAAPVIAHIYRNIATEQAADAESIGREMLLEMVHRAPLATPEPAEEAVTVAVVSGLQKGKVFLASLPCTIGRKDCAIVINDARVSRHHAELRLRDGALTIADLGSTNGTFVNGSIVEEKALAPDDLVTVGETGLKVSRGEA